MIKEKSKALCVICKIHLDKIEEVVFLCSRCKRQYVGEYEILSFEDEVGTAFDDQRDTIELEGISGVSSPIMETKKETNEYVSVLDRENKSKSDIKIPKYMQNSQTTMVTDFKEE